MQDSIEDYIRITRNTKSEPQIKNEVLTTAQIKKECESKAIQIVQFAIDGRLRPQALFRCLPFITQSHYQDIVEERAITKLCGYPLCAKQIPEMPKKQFHIATKSNKVYDITDRKNYCSHYCYNASIHIKQQIDTSPLWLQKHDKIPQFTVLNKAEKGLPGKLVDQGVIKPNFDHSFTSIADFTQFSLDEAEENEITQVEETKKTQKPIRKYSKSSMRTISENDEDEPEKDEAKSPSPEPETQPQSLPIPKTKERPRVVPPEVDVEALITKCFKEWITLETFIFIYGEERMVRELNSSKLSEYFEKMQIAEMQQEQKKKYMDICRKLHLKELAEQKFDSRIVGSSNLNPIPDFKQLKSENKEIELKVKSFYSGEIQIRDNSKGTEPIRSENSESGEESSPAVLPLVDVNSQTALRRRIFLNSLNKTMQSLFQSLRVSPNCVLSDLSLLVKSFKLKADNIVFKPHVWNVITIILLKMLCLKNQTIEEIIPKDRFSEITALWTSSLTQKEHFPESMIDLVRDFDGFVQDYMNCTEN